MKRRGGRLAAFPGILGADQDRSIVLASPLEDVQCRHTGDLDPDAPRVIAGACVNVSWRCRTCNVVVVEESFTLEAWRRLAGKMKTPRRS